MEKYKPTYDLEEFKRSDFIVTGTAYDSALDLGFNMKKIHQVISTMQKEHFYKSMTSYKNHKVWQDVYHVPYENFVLYVKFTKEILSEFTLLSFKEK